MAGIIWNGARLRFRQAVESDLDYIMEADHRPGNAEYVIPYSREKHLATLDTPDAIHVIVEEKATGAAVGFLMVAGLKNENNEVEWTRIVIDKKGCGYGGETLEMLKAWAFDGLKMHRAWLDCKDHNARALHVYEKAGLKREAFLRETILTDGRYENLIILAILDWEYRAARAVGGQGETVDFCRAGF